MDWLKAWETDDEAKQEDMIAQYMPVMYDILKDIPKPTKQQIKNPKLYMPEINKWIEKKLEKNAIEFFSVSSKALAYDTIKHAFKSVPEYLKNSKKIKALDTIATMLSQYMENYLANQYQLNVHTIESRVYPTGDPNLKQSGKNMEIFVPALVEGAVEYYNHAKDKDVEFVKMGKTKPKAKK